MISCASRPRLMLRTSWRRWMVLLQDREAPQAEVVPSVESIFGPHVGLHGSCGMKALTTIERRLQKARMSLLLDHPFFGSLLFGLKGRERPVDQDHGNRWGLALL